MGIYTVSMIVYLWNVQCNTTILELLGYHMRSLTLCCLPLGWLALKICASPYPAANKYQASAWSPKQTQEFELYPQASPLAEWLCVPSGKQMNVGSNPAVGASFFPARKTGVCYRYGAGVALGSQKQSIYA